MLSTLSALIFDIEANLPALASEYGVYIYLIIFIIILVECGIVVAPITGNSLLFLGGVLAAEGGLDVYWLIAVSAVGGVYRLCNKLLDWKIYGVPGSFKDASDIFLPMKKLLKPTGTSHITGRRWS